MRTKGIIWVLIVVFFLFSSVAQSLAFSIGEERAIGEKLLYSVRSTFNLVEDPDIVQYINNLGQTVLEVTGIQFFNYHFYVINNKAFNAFAAPSGLIFFYSGLIATMDSEDELVSVMAHEIGHIVKRHLAARVEKGKYSSIASLGLALAAIAFGGAAAPALLAGALATGQSINLHFSRQHEEEADLLAYGWMKKMKRNPEAQAKMLESMRRIARYRSDQLPQYLLTHPNPEGRLHYIESLLDIDETSNKKNSVVTDDFDFLRFKYRILSKVKDIQLFKTFLLRKIGDKNATHFSKDMALFGLSQVARVENDRKESLELIQKVIVAFPQKNILKTDLAIIEGESGHFDIAERTFKKALKTDNEDMYAAFNLATLLRKIGKTSEAEKYFKIVESQLPEYSQVYFELGKIASDNKQQGKAQFYLGKFDLYEGKLKLAETNFRNAMRHANTPEAIKKESKVLLAKIKKMRS